MKTLITGLIFGLVLVAISPSEAAVTYPSYSVMEKCLKKHQALMGKPALMNLRQCWQAHGYLMHGNQSNEEVKS